MDRFCGCDLNPVSYPCPFTYEMSVLKFVNLGGVPFEVLAAMYCDSDRKQPYPRRQCVLEFVFNG
jgi:hypothetical protein